MCTACGVTRASLVRARAARALSEAAESRRAVALVPGVRMYCTGCGAVRGASVSSCVLLWLFCGWALRRSHAEGRQPPIPKGWTSRSRRTSQPGPTSRAPVQRESRTVRPISLAFLGVQQTVGRQSTRATSVDRAAAGPFQPPRARLHASLNASAASESTTAGGLEAFFLSQSSAGAERFENASSKFRWNPSPLLPLSKELNVQRRHPGWLG